MTAIAGNSRPLTLIERAIVEYRRGHRRWSNGMLIYAANVALGLNYLTSALIGRDPRLALSTTITMQSRLGSRLFGAVYSLWPAHFDRAVESWNGKRAWSQWDRSLWR